ncbi:MATE family efflux transporter [Streptomyces sp. C11-1]|uniref:Probable multidrug resistance protein NorM n=1 Tax=Streptomyces durocortorensis TaxID=2811104 RepID=A0ABY9W8H9_9ACTN|nr:MATE family efflux transporter [Streptomyces durocortorensis]WNF29656.1 MATE family efflux transporter [Streptomyces durocortorensis]
MRAPRRLGRPVPRDRLFDGSVMREVVRVSVPLMFGMVGNLVLMLVDRICLARYSEETLQASGPAVFTATTLIMLATGTVGITRSYVAQANGRKDDRGTMDEGARGIALALVLCVLLLASTPLITSIPALSGQPEAVQELEAQYLGLSTLFGSVMTLNMALSSYFNGIGRTRVPMTVGLIGQAVGLVMTYGLVFGRLGLPEMGMRGSALGTLSAVVVMFVGYCVGLPKGYAARLTALLGQGARSLIHELWLRLRRGAPAGGSMGLEELGQTAFVWLAGVLGLLALSANNVALSLNYAAVIPLIGLGLGCNILCGNAIGAGLYTSVPRIMRSTLLVCGAYVAVVAFFQIVTPTLLLSPFGLNEAGPETVESAVDTSRVLWTYSAAFMFSMVGSAVLECFGLSRFGFLTRIVLMWCLCVPTIATVVLTHRGEADLLPVIWLIFSFFEAVMAVVCLWRIRKAVANRENLLVEAGPPAEDAETPQPACTDGYNIPRTESQTGP